MTTFDLAGVRSFTASLTTQLDLCDNGEGTECATIDAVFRHYAATCCNYVEEVKRWCQEVFAGRVALDPDVDRLLRSEGSGLYLRALEVAAYGRKAEETCYACDEHGMLNSALWSLYRILYPWVTPRLAVGPSARLGLPLSGDQAEEARRRLAALAPLSADWTPDDPRQRRRFERFKRG